MIPVARVRAAGGAGFGEDAGNDAGGGGGGYLDAVPLGFIDISAAGARFEAIDDPEATARTLRAAAAAATTLIGALAVRRGVRRRPAGLLTAPRRSLRR